MSLFKFSSYIHKVKQEVRIEKPLLLIQRFVPEFETFYEVRTYWMNGSYSHSIGTIINPTSLGTSGFEEVRFAYPENEYDTKEFQTYDEIPEKIDQSLNYIFVASHFSKLCKSGTDRKLF